MFAASVNVASNKTRGIEALASQTEAEILKVKEGVAKMAQRSDRAGQRARRWLKVFDIASERDPAERHRKIRALPVEFLKEPTAGGTFVSTIVEGKLMSRTFLPEAQPENQATSGPQQMELHEQPDGSKADEPIIPNDLCEDEEGWAECATPQEKEDAEILMAYYAYEGEMVEAEQIALEEAALDCYYYYNCSELEPAAVQVPDGGSPDLAPPCVDEIRLAAASAGAFALGAWGSHSYIQAATAITKRAILGFAGLNALVLVGVAVLAVGAYNCYQNNYQLNISPSLEAPSFDAPRVLAFRP